MECSRVEWFEEGGREERDWEVRDRFQIKRGGGVGNGGASEMGMRNKEKKEGTQKRHERKRGEL